VGHPLHPLHWFMRPYGTHSVPLIDPGVETQATIGGPFGTGEYHPRRKVLFLLFFNGHASTRRQTFFVMFQDGIVVGSSPGLRQGCPLDQQLHCTFPHVHNRSTQELRQLLQSWFQIAIRSVHCLGAKVTDAVFDSALRGEHESRCKHYTKLAFVGCRTNCRHFYSVYRTNMS